MWVDINRPSPEKFRLALQRKGIAAPPVADIRELFYKYQSSKQIFAPAPKYKGKIFSPGLDRRWAADIMVTAGKYTLIVQDIFSRYAWAEPIDSPMSASHGMEEVLRRAGKTPDELDGCRSRLPNSRLQRAAVDEGDSPHPSRGP